MLSRGRKPLSKTYANPNPNANANTEQEPAERRQDANECGHHISAAPDWQELMAAMKTMDAAMASV